MPSELDKFLNTVNEGSPQDVQNENPFKQFDEVPPTGEEGDEGKKDEDTKDDEGADDKDDDTHIDIPFHKLVKNPKFQRFLSKEVAKATEGMAPRESAAIQTAAQNSETQDEMIAAFTAIIGNDTPEKVHALKMLENGMKNIREEARSGQRQFEEQRRAEQEAEKELEDGLESVEDSFDVDMTSNTPKARKLKADFIDFVEKLAPKDKDGNVKEYPDFEYAFELFKEKTSKPAPSNDRKKDLASRGLQRSSDASNIPQPQGNSWKDVERFFSRFEDK